MSIKSLCLSLLVPFVLKANSHPKYDPWVYEKNIQPAVFSLTMVMMHDVVNPPAASRYYAYQLMGALAIVAKNNPSITSPEKYVSHFPAITISMASDKYDYKAAALYCILETGRLMLPTGSMLEKEQADMISAFRKRLNEKKISNSLAVSKDVAQQIIKYSQGDHYNKLSVLPRYRPTGKEANWFPTPPAYLDAVEPHWTTMRPMMLDSAKQFIIDPPVPFDTTRDSEFYKLAMEVYQTVNSLTDEQTDIASFWDCNPFVVANEGHMSLGFKKITPGGHWMNITSIASEKAGLDFDHSIFALALQGINLYDAFLACWDEKYTSNRVRPETFINKHIDLEWKPILQTPPFPEYTSGHSVISTAAAELLTFLLGDNFSFLDDTELIFELKPRTFHSFREAANEAAISRLYGGIHFMDAISFGQKQGRAVGKYVVERLKNAGVKPFI